MNRFIQKKHKFFGNKLSRCTKPFDLKIFENRETDCHVISDDIPITEQCSATARLCTASMYFDALKSSKIADTAKKTLFIEFNEVIYDKILDDTIHFVTEHEGDITRVRGEWTEKYGFPECSVKDCIHYLRKKKRNTNMIPPDEDKDAQYACNESLYDRIHNYIFHLFDIGGKRIVDAPPKSENNKFTINLAQGQDVGGMTLTDAVFKELFKFKIHSELLPRIHLFLQGNGFDTDAVEMDLENDADSNLGALINNQNVIESIKKYIQIVKLNRSTFSTGFEFNYDPLNKDEGIFVAPKYQNLKEEVLENGYLSPSKWMEYVDLKARKYWKLEKTQKLHDWGMKNGYTLTVEHLHAVILYCDIIRLCTAFSRTCRLENVFETVESVAARHSSFANLGNLLVEMVQRFGISRIHGNGADEPESGPFYMGINCPLNIGTFAITLKGPCSTSTKRSVSLNFARSDGLILKLNNDSWLAEEQSFLNVSWISNYFEENERLFIAGKYPLRLVDIKNVRRAKNYYRSIHSFYLFDAMISGVHLKSSERAELLRESDEVIMRALNLDGRELKDWKEEMSKESELCAEATGSIMKNMDEPTAKSMFQSDSHLISALTEMTLEGKEKEMTDFDYYIINEWTLFLHKKKEVDLRMKDLDNDYGSMSKLVMFDVVKNTEERNADGKDNLLRMEWLWLFTSLQRVCITTSGKCYKFSLEALLDLMESIPPKITLIFRDRGEWIERALVSEIVAAFDALGWSAEYVVDDEKLVIKSKEE